jgi:hypothetical protein
MISLKIFLLLVILALVTTDALVVPQRKLQEDLSLQQSELFQQVRKIILLPNYVITVATAYCNHG